MNFFNWLFSPWSRKGEESLSGGGAWGGIGSRSASGQNITPDNSMTVPAVLACVRVLAEGLAQLPWHVYERRSNGTKRLADEYLLAPVLDNPNSWQTDFEFKELMMVCLALRGNFYAVKVAGVNGAATELWPLHPDRVKIEVLENKSLRYKVKEASGVEVVFLQDEIFHVRWMSLDGINGLSPIRYAAEAIGSTKAAEVHGAAFFKNQARPLVVLETPNALKADAAEKLLAGWRQMHGGPYNAGSTALLTNGLKAHELGVSMVDAQYIETRRFGNEDIARIFRVPPHMIGDLTRSTNNNIEQQSLEFVMFTLLPWLVRIEKAAKRDLITDARYYVKFNVEGMLRGDQSSRFAAYQTAINTGLMSINECRELEDLNPIENGDTHFIQGAMVPVERIVNPPEPPAPAPAPAPDPSVGQMSAEIVELKAENEEQRNQLREVRAVASMMREIADDERNRRLAAEAMATEMKIAADAAINRAAMAAEQSEQSTARLSQLADQMQAERDNANEWAEIAARAKAEKDMAIASLNEELIACRAVRLHANDAATGEMIDRVDDMIELECEAARRALNKDNFLSAVDAMREKTTDRMGRALAGPARVMSALRGSESRLAREIESHVARSHSELLAAAEVPQDQLAASVERVLATWPARASEFVANLFEEKTDAAGN